MISKSQYQKIFNRMPQPFAYFQLVRDENKIILDFIMLSMNDAYIKLTECSTSVIGMKLSECQTDKEKRAFKWLKSCCEYLLQLNGMHTYHLQQRGKWYEITCIRIDEEGIAVTAADITTLNYLEKQNKKLKDNYENVINSTYDAVFLIDVSKDGKITYNRINKSHEKATGLKSDDIKGKSPREVFGDQLGTDLETNYLKCIRNKDSVTYEETLTINHSPKTWLTTLSPVIEKGKVVQVIGISRDITESIQTEEKLVYVSFHDSLTGLYNRAYFDRQLKELDKKEELPLSIIAADINGLKLSNDVFGHTKGDELLNAIAEILRSSCRAYDTIARWGGDEFSVILPRTSNENAELICERIKEKCREAAPTPIKPSLALGLATKSEMYQSIETILAEAEEEMYKNKLKEGKKFRESIILSFQSRLDEQNKRSIAYYQRMTELAKRIEKEMYLSEKEKEALDMLIILHDIGNVGVCESILNKTEKLGEEESCEIRKHPEIGYRIAQAIAETAYVADLILTHHERWDGMGYPQGLRGTQIPKVSRIFALMDAYETMTHHRPYKKAMSHEEALKELEQCRGCQFDPELTDRFIKIISLSDKNKLM